MGKYDEIINANRQYNVTMAIALMQSGELELKKRNYYLDIIRNNNSQFILQNRIKNIRAENQVCAALANIRRTTETFQSQNQHVRHPLKAPSVQMEITHEGLE